MDWWTQLRLAFGAFLDQHGLLAGFVLLLLEEAGVPIPIPGDFLMLLLGVQARRHLVSLPAALAALEAATVVGASILYAAARLAGRGLVYRYGRFIHLTPSRLDRAERWITRHGTRAVFFGRLIPGLRIVTSAACGVFAVPYRVFLPSLAVGGLLYIAVYLAIGDLLGPPALSLLDRLKLPSIGLLGSLIPLLVIIWWAWRAHQELQRRPRGERLRYQPRVRAGALAGAIATIASALLLNVVVNVAGNLAFQTPGRLMEVTASRLTFAAAQALNPVLLFVVAPLFVAVGVLWGAAYGAVDNAWGTRLPDWLRGLLFALLPLGVSLLLVLPALGLGLFSGRATGHVTAIAESVRHLSYGVLLGLIYPVLAARTTDAQRPTPPSPPPTPISAGGGRVDGPGFASWTRRHGWDAAAEGGPTRSLAAMEGMHDHRASQ